ncbi:MAG TPA: hypothetical protein VJY62_11490 [Bacteroidia bacterium]|nr:hypothetical protein [Bacteroidia bacterium]
MQKYFFLFAISIFSFINVYSQNFSAVAKIDSAEILIGKQARVTLELTHPKNQKIQWTEIPDTLGKVEIIEKTKIDTAFASDSISVINKQELILTCFDSGYYVIPPFRFIDASDPDTNKNFAETLPLLLTVKTIPVDTTKAIKEIKAPVEVPFSFEDILPYSLGVLILAAAVIVAILLYKKYKKKPVTRVYEKPKRPAHEIAIEELNKLREEKLWQKGDFKYYHTRLTDIIRLYLWHRYDVNAMEMTTDEILANHPIKQLNGESFSKLKYMLELADFVKFAKVIPVANENEQSLSNAFEFVNGTKLVVSLTAKAPEVKTQAVKEVTQ